MRALIIRADGSEQYHEVPYVSIRALIGAETLDTVNLRDGRVMLVDDLGHAKGKPLNQRATDLYHGICVPGTTHQIVGDVAIIIDAEIDAL